jgi:copper oxidase (laccase) domain-containing protein
MLDLERANRDQLVRAGLAPESIFASGLCTKTHHARLHSYRAAGAGAGRILAAIRTR